MAAARYACCGSNFAELASAGKWLGMAIAAINTGNMRCLLQRSDGLLIVAQPLAHQISIYLVQLARCFRQLNEFLPSFGCTGKIPQFILNAQAIGGMALLKSQRLRASDS